MLGSPAARLASTCPSISGCGCAEDRGGGWGGGGKEGGEGGKEVEEEGVRRGTGRPDVMISLTPATSTVY